MKRIRTSGRIRRGGAPPSSTPGASPPMRSCPHHRRRLLVTAAHRLFLVCVLLLAPPPTTRMINFGTQRTVIYGGIVLVAADCPPNNDCGPYGECILDTRSCGNDCQEKCKCDPGYFGYDCSYQAQVCPNSILGAADGAQECYNGGTCYPVTQLGGSSSSSSSTTSSSGTTDAAEEVYYMCDCRKAYGDAGGKGVIYAGHQCEYPAQTSCEINVASSSYAFCVNGGKCMAMVQSGAPPPNCTCPTGFVGRHCQYEYGTAPPKELEYSPPASANGGNPLSPVAIFFLVLLATSFVVGVAVFAWRRQRSRDLADKVELHMSSIGSSSNNNHQPALPSTPHDLYLHDDADEDEKEIASSPEWTRSNANGSVDRRGGDALQPPEREII